MFFQGKSSGLDLTTYIDQQKKQILISQGI